MTSLFLRISIEAVRTWTRLYTCRMPRSVREARRAEIESDLWECQTDEAAGPALPVQIMGRLALGVFDDLCWRVEHGARGSHVTRRTIALAGGTAAVLACLWAGLAMSLAQPPQPPAAPEVRWRRTPYPPPPPPPPPPCNPPGIGRKPFSPCTPYQ
jgi:hypothetical protein